ncbi:MAG: metallophosphoesterase family protein [Calditrichia bacterium]
MKFGLISDTHDHLPESAVKALKNSDLIIHAGDIGNEKILKRLGDVAPVKAVYGNTDIYSIASILPSRLCLKYEGITIHVQHNIGNIKNFIWKMKRGDIEDKPGLVVFGHTHHPYFQQFDKCWFANPGSAGIPRGGVLPTVMLLEIKEGRIINHQIIKL